VKKFLERRSQGKKHPLRLEIFLLRDSADDRDPLAERTEDRNDNSGVAMDVIRELLLQELLKLLFGQSFDHNLADERNDDQPSLPHDALRTELGVSPYRNVDGIALFDTIGFRLGGRNPQRTRT